MAKRPKTVSVRIYEETRNALLAVQSRMRADQVRLGLPRKKSRFADLIAVAFDEPKPALAAAKGS